MSTPIKVTVGTSSTTVASTNTSRKRLWLVNSGNYAAYLMYSNPAGGTTQSAAVVGQGIRLNPHGGTYTTTSPDTFYAVCTNAGGQVSGYDE